MEAGWLSIRRTAACGSWNSHAASRPKWEPGRQRTQSGRPTARRIVFRKGGPPNLFYCEGGRKRGRRENPGVARFEHALDWSPDGSWLLYHRLSNDISAQTRSSLWVWPTRGGEPRPYLQTPHRQGRRHSRPTANGSHMPPTSRAATKSTCRASRRADPNGGSPAPAGTFRGGGGTDWNCSTSGRNES